jgi:hypothetical protein
MPLHHTIVVSCNVHVLPAMCHADNQSKRSGDPSEQSSVDTSL